MRTAAAVSSPAGLRLEDIELLPLEPHGVLLRVGAANVGAADAMVLPDLPDLPPPDLPPDLVGMPPHPTHLVNGHGGAAIVEEVGERVERVRPGQRVIVTSTPNCGTCRFCLRGLPQFCALLVPFGRPFATMADGTPVHGNSSVGLFARHAVSTEFHCTPVDTQISDEHLALLSNPVVTGAGAALITAPVRPGSTVAVVGCGTVGLAYVQAARFAGAERIIAVEPLPERRAAALLLGATDALDPHAVDPAAEVRRLAGDGGGVPFGQGADYVFEAAGDARALEQAWAMTGLGGHLVCSGIAAPGTTVSFPMSEFAVVAGRTVHPCQQGSALMARDLPWLVGLTERGVFDLAAMTERTYRLDETATALADVAARRVLGAAVIPSSADETR